jgi:hypothetical protein
MEAAVQRAAATARETSASVVMEVTRIQKRLRGSFKGVRPTKENSRWSLSVSMDPNGNHLRPRKKDVTTKGLID